MSDTNILSWNTDTEASNAEVSSTSISQAATSTKEDVTAIDFNQLFSMPAKDPGGFTILSPGNYVARITGIARGTHSPKPGGKYPACGKIEVAFTVYPTPDTPVICRKTYYLIGEKTAVSQMYYLFKATDLLNEDGTFGNRWDDLVGKVVEVTISETTSERTGKTYHNQITRVTPPSVTDDDLPF